MSRIITHPGTAHRDDFLSISLVLAKDSEVTVIERREPSLAEIKDSNIWVLDVGRTLDSQLRAFDHHQKDFNEKWNSNKTSYKQNK